MEVNGDKAFNESLQAFHQFLWYRERSNQRFYELEELIRVAAQKMEVLNEKELKKKRSPTFVNPLVKVTNAGTEDAKPHLKPKLPNSEEDSEVFDCAQHQDDSEEIYTEKPIFDEEPEESHKCWMEQVCTQTKAGEEYIGMVKRIDQPGRSARFPVSNRVEGSFKFGKLANQQGSSQSLNSFGMTTDAGNYKPQQRNGKDSLKHLKLEFPSFTKGVTSDYEGAHVFDEDPREEECDAGEQHLILSALGGQTQPSGGPSQYVETCQGKEIQILIDGGSSMNLVSQELCNKLCLSLQDQDTVKIAVPNGTTLTSATMWPESQLSHRDTMESKGSVAQLTEVVSLWKEQIAGSNEEVTPVMCTNLRDLTDEVPYSENTTTGDYHDKYVLIFDPGGSMQRSMPTSASDLGNQPHASQQAGLPRSTSRLTSENPVKYPVNSSNKVLENGGEPQFADYKSVEEQNDVEEESSVVPTSRRNSDDSYGLDMIRIQEKKLEGVTLRKLPHGQSGQGQVMISFMVLAIKVVQSANPIGIQCQDFQKAKDDLTKARRLEDPKASKKDFTIYVFDPGGKKLEEDGATTRTWLILKRGGLSGTAPD